MMKKVVLIALLALPAVAAAQQGQRGNTEVGQRAFMRQNCYYCHGTTGQGSRDGARLAQTALNVQGFTRYVRQPTGAMPAYTAKILSDQELADIFAYLKALPAAKNPKDIPLLDQLTK